MQGSESMNCESRQDAFFSSKRGMGGRRRCVGRVQEKRQGKGSYRPLENVRCVENGQTRGARCCNTLVCGEEVSQHGKNSSTFSHIVVRFIGNH